MGPERTSSVDVGRGQKKAVIDNPAGNGLLSTNTRATWSTFILYSLLQQYLLPTSYNGTARLTRSFAVTLRLSYAEQFIKGVLFSLQVLSTKSPFIALTNNINNIDKHSDIYEDPRNFCI